MRTFAIGDIHGCLTALETLLEFIEPKADDRLIFLGDYMDRGPDSRGVVEKLISLSQNPNNVFLRGNHDDWMLEARTNRKMFNSWLAVGGKETLKSYEAINLDFLPAEHFEFFEKTQFYFEDENHIFAHAAVSERPIELNTPRWLMWGNFSEIKEHPSGKRIIVGHSAQRSGLPIDKGFVVCIDTYCYGTGWLTAFDVNENQVFQANESGETRTFSIDQMNDL